MEKPHMHHEIVRPVRELVAGSLNFVVDKVLGGDLFSDIFNGTDDNSPLDEPVFTAPVAPRTVPPTAPDIAGRDL